MSGAENVIVLANPVKPHSRGEIVLASADPTEAPDIRMNYYSDPHDLDVMVAVVRKALEVVDNWPGADALGPMYVPTALAKAHDHEPGDTPSDELIRDMARHYSTTVYHLTSTCRVNGVAGLRVADASVMSDVISGNTNAPVIMIGEKAAEMIAADHGLSLREHVGAS